MQTGYIFAACIGWILALMSAGLPATGGVQRAAKAADHPSHGKNGPDQGPLEVRWDLQVGQPARALSVWRGVLVAGMDRSGTVVAVDLQTGRMRWRQKVPASIHNAPAIQDSLVIIT